VSESFRIEEDTMGTIKVPKDCYYGAQTARSLIYFSTGEDLLTRPMIRALGIVKKSIAQINCLAGKLPKDKADLIIQASQEVIDGKLDAQFPLRIWQTGSGTQSNMNANEVIANRAIELGGKIKGDKSFIHPNDHVNLSHSSNDAFPSAMHIAAVEQITHRLLPALRDMRDSLEKKVKEFSSIIKIGRTHLMDATPLSLGQEFSGYAAQLQDNIERIEFSLLGLYKLPIGGSAVGTGLNTPKDFGPMVAQAIAEITKIPFAASKNPFSLMAAHDGLVFASGALRTLAGSLMKLSSDISWMGSGPRCGLHELFLPQNEPGSSIMPGKVNPTQCEALNMVCLQVLGNDTAIAMAGSQGNFELNVFKPMIIENFLHSTLLLSDVCQSFNKFLLQGVRANEKRIHYYLHQSLMLVTALTPKIGYDKAAQIARLAFEKDLSLREANRELGFLSEQEFNTLIDPQKMTHSSYS
jgi:fumarate hydratase class II